MADPKDKSGYRESDEPLTDRACVRCAHYRVGEADVRGQHLCERPQLGASVDRVIGASVPNSKDAYEERKANGPDACGPEGKFWSQSGF
jgi:hypothetical protein